MKSTKYGVGEGYVFEIVHVGGQGKVYRLEAESLEEKMSFLKEIEALINKHLAVAQHQSEKEKECMMTITPSLSRNT